MSVLLVGQALLPSSGLGALGSQAFPDFSRSWVLPPSRAHALTLLKAQPTVSEFLCVCLIPLGTVSSWWAGILLYLLFP